MELHTYYSKKKLLRVTWGKRIDIHSLRRHFELLKANDNYSRDLLVITSSDVEEIDIPLTRENMLVLRDWRTDALRDYRSITTAIYNLKPIPSAYLNYFSEFFDAEKSKLRQFASEEVALSWLMKGQSVL